jgi:hypothetical protein
LIGATARERAISGPDLADQVGLDPLDQVAVADSLGGGEDVGKRRLMRESQAIFIGFLANDLKAE